MSHPFSNRGRQDIDPRAAYIITNHFSTLENEQLKRQAGEFVDLCSPPHHDFGPFTLSSTDHLLREAKTGPGGSSGGGQAGFLSLGSRPFCFSLSGWVAWPFLGEQFLAAYDVTGRKQVHCRICNIAY